jgi:hypothetical protein
LVARLLLARPKGNALVERVLFAIERGSKREVATVQTVTPHLLALAKAGPYHHTDSLGETELTRRMSRQVVAECRRLPHQRSTSKGTGTNKLV